MMDNKNYTETSELFSVCENIRKQLPDFLEGCLDDVSAEVVRAHISVCVLCERFLNEMQKTISLIESLPIADRAEDLSPRIISSIQEEIEKSLSTSWWKRFFP